MRPWLLAPLLLLAGQAPAPSPDLVTVDLSSYRFTPATIVLASGRAVTLRLHNPGGGGHSFSAPRFFASAQIDPASSALVKDGRVEVPGGGSIDIQLVPAAGSYPLKCSHAFHSAFGMKGQIVVR